jgi:Na+/phosphate symporter
MDWIELLGGIAIFIYGQQLANDGLQKRAGDQCRIPGRTGTGYAFLGFSPGDQGDPAHSRNGPADVAEGPE